MEIKNFRSSVSYTLVCYNEDLTIASEINYKIRKNDNGIMLSWIEFIEESINVDGIYIQKSPTPLFEKGGVLTYVIAYDKHKYDIEVKYEDDRMSNNQDKSDCIEQLAADLFEKSIRLLVDMKVHVPGLVLTQEDGINLSVRRHRD